MQSRNDPNTWPLLPSTTAVANQYWTNNSTAKSFQNESNQVKKGCTREMNEINKKFDDFLQKCQQELKTIEQQIQIQREMLKIVCNAVMKQLLPTCIHSTQVVLMLVSKILEKEEDINIKAGYGKTIENLKVNADLLSQQLLFFTTYYTKLDNIGEKQSNGLNFGINSLISMENEK
ncbi:unnamed protein product [Didymodactylos carnosus]|uniref:Uncharacterized protein n=2 Tax=Didymodactylos carnosus TaxID=1234261 RepID=A0A8S2JW69_9BILA|nr:unnamed protein product [Didymodactylos carnosus]CAF3828160.1 unnamed protein product [Didymodactylos carnosus]